MQASGHNESCCGGLAPPIYGAKLAGCKRATRTAMGDAPLQSDLTNLANKYGIAPDVIDDWYARRRAGARDAELVNLLTQQDRGGLDPEQTDARAAELPAR
jgi:hypothetical protein